MNESIMPLVEENRALHDRVRLLEFELNQQAVRIDAMLETGWPTKSDVEWLEVDADPTLRAYGRIEALELMAKSLGEQLARRVDRLAMKVMVDPLRGPIYRFLFLAVRR